MDLAVDTLNESLHKFNFYRADVLTDAPSRQLRRHRLERAQALGNLYRHKVTLTFRDEMNHAQRVYTTVWAVCEEHVALKGNRLIPIRSIESVLY
ncbi:MAG: hypothetical protein WBA12_03135 [Catalinimonas sp.]